MLKYAGAWLLFILGGISLFYGNKVIIDNEYREWKLTREIIHADAVKQFTYSIEKFALLASGVKAYLESDRDYTSGEELRSFIREQVRHIGFEDSLVVSVLDNEHNFRLSVSSTQIDPSGLIGANVRDFRGNSSIRVLEAIMEDSDLHMFKPLNLMEGWVGISFNFSIWKNGVQDGYGIAVLNFENAMSSVYSPSVTDDFCFHFSTLGGADFDRAQVHDSSKVYHSRADPEYYANFDQGNLDFVYSEIDLYGLQFRLGTSYKQPFATLLFIPVLSGVWYLLLSYLLYNVYQQSRQRARMNVTLKEAKIKLESKKKELEETNQELLAANASKSKFFSIIGHDLKSPLRSIHTLLDLRRENIISSAEADDMLEDLSDHVDRTTKLIDDLMTWATINKDQQEVNFQTIQVTDIIKDTTELCQSAAGVKNITIKTDVAEGIDIEGDADMIATIIRNVLSNAVKFTPKTGLIEVSAGNNGVAAEITIKDHGIGMNEAEIETLFRIDRELTGKGTEGETGSGLGLILCKEYVDLHNGEITVSSKEGSGSTFCIRLPKSQKG